jgi:hypothetical protein
LTEHRFPPPWSVDDPDMKLGQECYIVRDERTIGDDDGLLPLLCALTENPADWRSAPAALPNPRQKAPADTTRITAITRQFCDQHPVFGDRAMEQKRQTCDHQESRRNP